VLVASHATGSRGGNSDEDTNQNQPPVIAGKFDEEQAENRWQSGLNDLNEQKSQVAGFQLIASGWF
jgi:hypothetical protein